MSSLRKPGVWSASLLTLFAVVLLCSCRQGNTAIAANPPAQAAEEAKEIPGLSNFGKVSDSLYRGAQPTEEGFKRLKEMGVKTIINLRSFHSDKDKIKGQGFYYASVALGYIDPEEKDIIRFLKIVETPKYQPVFVHCQYGSDRTGTAVAAYRIVVQGWAKEDAQAELPKYGYHTIWRGLKKFIGELDVEGIKKRVAEAPEPDLETP
jgi:protein tyrosine/serine phosphatase